MRISHVLLRRYKSFNVSLTEFADRRADSVKRPWNALGYGDIGHAFAFIEIPTEPDITTIVGANESGKSHLLSAISKVVTGEGGPTDLHRRYGRTDLCHFSSSDSANADVWPEIGLTFTDLSADEWTSLKTVGTLGQVVSPPGSLTLVVVSDAAESDVQAHVFCPGFAAKLNAEQLTLLRAYLPAVRFIDAAMAIGDHVDIGELISGYGAQDVDRDEWFGFGAAQKAAQALMRVAFSPGQPLDAGSAQSLAQVREDISRARMQRSTAPDLEVLLFRDVLGVELSTLKLLAGLPASSRSYADSIVASWNRRLDERLNLSRYWQQDDQFSLRIDFKQGTLFFEITDKTGAVYTFRERSSGLRYFLSYYIQAKAIELRPNRPGVILMDEPDSFLSVVGQRNLLSIFESLVSFDSSKQGTQLFYTTHSPFLVNRNFPRRVRLVRKGDGEEGTQFVDAARVRRYEPVRSALGIDCAQTLFMGATNLVLEGPVDQLLISELIRQFWDRSSAQPLLDLNSLVVVSAESAPRIPKLLDASLWEDEPNPAVVVLVDSDDEGLQVGRLLTGQARNVKQRVRPEFVLYIAEILGASADGQAIVTIEDLLTPSIYKEALRRYLAKYGYDLASHSSRLEGADLTRGGIVDGTSAFFREIEGRQVGSYDKLGVAECVLDVVRELREAPDGRVAAGPTRSMNQEITEVHRRLSVLCARLREAVADSAAGGRRESTKQAIARHLHSYLTQRHRGSSLFDLERLVKRMQAEVEALGKDDVSLADTLRRWREELTTARATGTQRIDGMYWSHTAQLLRRLQHDPFAERATEALLLIEDGAGNSDSPGAEHREGVPAEASVPNAN
jgi:ABC-type cobalamin/Fe3+-siderophores transport system ATPase subunit